MSNWEENEGPQGIKFGLISHCVVNLVEKVQQLTDDQFDFLCVPLAHPRYQRILAPGKTNTSHRQLPFTRSDLILEARTWSSFIVGILSPWVIFDDNQPEPIIRNNKLVLSEEIAWARHLSLPSVILPFPSWDCGCYASFLNQHLIDSHYFHMQVWITVPLTLRRKSRGKASNLSDPWEYWNKLRTLCDYNPRLFVALQVTEDLPSDDHVPRWLGEPVKLIILPSSIFLTNAKGFPVLSKRHQNFISRFFQYGVAFALSGQTSHPKGSSVYLKYMSHLFSNQPPLSAIDRFERPYWDYLQSPLQPLSDNLESQTYETFERDKTKYNMYEEAVFKALKSGRFTAPVTLMVVGAGRGPLVKSSLRASARANVAIRVYAVEKNPNAVVTLLNLKSSNGWTNVQIVNSDMRTWNAPDQADIIVSELLGSFGDNELSPECLAGAMRHLKDTGISIPSSYTSYVAPLSSSKLYNEVRSFKDVSHFETAFVVQFHNVNILTPAQPCFTFVHPDPDLDLTRYIRINFKVQTSATLHGFAGYFDATLYDDVHISIYPPTHTQGMFSWFPIYFPIRTPIYAPANSEIEVHFWRLDSPKKVWYEWCVTKPSVSFVHNSNGKCYMMEK